MAPVAVEWPARICVTSAQRAGWVERLVRRSSQSEGGCDTHRDIGAKMLGFAKAQPNLRAACAGALCHSAALVPIERIAKLGQNQERVMKPFQALLACGALLVAAAPSAWAEGTFEIPAGAHFNKDKLAKLGEFFRNEVTTGKIPGAILLVQQHGKPVYRSLRRTGRGVEGADHRPDYLPLVLDDQGHHQRGCSEDAR